MRLLVSGGTGFVGARIVREALAAGDVVAVISRSGIGAGRLANVADRVTSLVSHFGDVDRLAPGVQAFAPDAVVHTAWFGVGNQFRHDPRQLDANLAGSAALVTLAADAGARVFVGIGSQAEYGPQEGLLDEAAVTTPTTRYGVAKLAAGHLCRIAAAERGLRFAWLRLFSSYGPGDNPEWMLPSLARQLLQGERPALTPGDQRWDFIHVSDVARATLAVARSERASGVFNLGSGDAPPLRRTVETVRDYIDPSLPLGFGEVAYRPDQVMWLQADVTRLTAATGWVPIVPLAEGLQELVDDIRVAAGSGATA